MNPLIIYRAKSLDSFASAFAAWLHNPDFQFHAALPGEEPRWSDAKGRITYLLDYSYGKEWSKRLSRVAKCLIVLDHHEATSVALKECLGKQRLRGVIDHTKSGVALTWDWFHGTELPKLLAHISDAHLNKWELRDTKEIVRALEQKPREFREWEKYLHQTDSLINGEITENSFTPMYCLAVQDIDAHVEHKIDFTEFRYMLPDQAIPQHQMVTHQLQREMQ